MSKDAYYFPHDSNARNDQRLMKIRMDYGITGYGVYFGIIEILREQTGYYLNRGDIDGIAFDLRVEKDVVDDIIKSYDLFEIDGDIWYSRSLKRRMERLDERRQKLSKAGRKGGLSKASVENKQPLSSKVNKSKVKESKVKDIINISFEKFWCLYNYKVGDKGKIRKKWELLTDLDRGMVMEHLPHYIKSTPDKQYRKHPSTYLNNQGWFDEIINTSNGVDKFKVDSTGFPMAYCDKCGVSASYRKEELTGESRCCQGNLLAERPNAKSV